MNTKLPDIATDFAEWYNEVVRRAKLADHAPVRGCMVIRPYGCAIWENIQAIVDKKIKDTGHQNALFPLFIPKSFLDREKDHVAGFSPELAVVTHAGGKQLEEPLVVRPTSETVIHYMFAQWLTSWRDLPLKINQWANVVRWEMRPRAFLRTTEFWWQEGHTAHETEAEADEETLCMLEQYRDLIENYLAIPVFAGQKSEQEKFAGALKTFTLEAIMPDGKALQMCTSHRISQTFAHAFDMKFQDRNGNVAFPHLTSWGITTRTIGAMIMTHGDNKGLVVPPRIAPIQVIIIAISNEKNHHEIHQYVQSVEQELKSHNIRVAIDHDTQSTPGAKFYEAELRGIPLRVEIGPRDMINHVVTVVERLGSVKETVIRTEIAAVVEQKLTNMQHTLYEHALVRFQHQAKMITALSDIAQFIEQHRGYFVTSWCGTAACETALKEYKCSIRCLRPESSVQNFCFCCKNPRVTDIIIARSY